MAAILLLGVITRLPTLINVPMWSDEVWTMWQTQGTLAQTIQLTPYDWPPGYYALMRGWTWLVGHNDIAGRYFSLLCGLLAIALMYRVGIALLSGRPGGKATGRWVGSLAALITAVLPYTTYLTVEARGYALLAVAVPLTLWQHIRLLNRPSIGRAISYGLALALCLYTSYTGLLVIGLCLAHGLPTLWLRRQQNGSRRSLIGWAGAVGVLIICAIPLSIRLGNIVALRRQNITDHLVPPGIDQMPVHFITWLAGGQPLIFGILAVAAGIGIVVWLRATQWRASSDRGWRQRVSYLAIWAVVAPVMMYVFRYWLLMGALRYLFYFVPGIILVIALGLSRWPHPTRVISLLLILVYALSPIPLADYHPSPTDARPIRDLVRELGKDYQPGDAIWIDPACTCGAPFEWSYYESVYFPGGVIQSIGTPADAVGIRRLWTITDQSTVSPNLRQTLINQRAHTAFFGPPYLIADLYEAPPHVTPLQFGAGERFYGADLPRVSPLHPGDTMLIRMWWSVSAGDPGTAMVTLSIRDPASGDSLAETAAPLTGSPAPGQPLIAAKEWPPGTLVVETCSIVIPATLASGSYPVTARLTSADGQPITATATGTAFGNASQTVVSLGTVEVFHPYTYSH